MAFPIFSIDCPNRCPSRNPESITIFDFFFCPPHSGAADCSLDDPVQEVCDAATNRLCPPSLSSPLYSGPTWHCAWKTSHYDIHWPSTNRRCIAHASVRRIGSSEPGSLACGLAGTKPSFSSSTDSDHLTAAAILRLLATPQSADDTWQASHCQGCP